MFLKIRKQCICLLLLIFAVEPVFAGKFIVPAGKTINNQYIVVLKSDIPLLKTSNSILRQLAGLYSANLTWVYGTVLNGGVMKMPKAVAKLMALNPLVAYVQQDSVIDLIQPVLQPVLDLLFAPPPSPPAGLSWGLDRIDQRNLPLDGDFRYQATGAGVTAYLIDSGIRATHQEFSGRATVGIDTVGDGRKGVDCNGHGTHVAGTLGGETYGVAKDVTIKAVRVLNCSGQGTASGVVAGIDWVTNDYLFNKSLFDPTPAVANMSIGGVANTAIDDAVANSIQSGIIYSIAAGNDGVNACLYSPARVPAAITVGATTSDDQRASYSNTGSCLDIFAPGSEIPSAWNSGDQAANTLSGTSMATPHVSGVAALYLQTNPYATPQQVADALVTNATNGVVSSPGANSPDSFLFTDY